MRDFNNATRHLTRVERSIYRDLVELYYEEESQLPKDKNFICRKVLARTNEELTAVEQVLNEFFTETPTGYYHARCEEELERYKGNSTSKAIAGKASAAARAKKKQQALNIKPTGVEQVLNSVETEDRQNPTNHKPVTINQEPRTNTAPAATGADAQVSAKISVDNFFAEFDHLASIRELRPELELHADAIKLTFTVFWEEQNPIRDDWLAQWKKWVRAEKVSNGS